MAFEKEITLEDCLYSYAIGDNIKNYTLKDVSFVQNKFGNYELIQFLEKELNSSEGFPLKITINEDKSAFKLIITDQSGLRLVNIFKTDHHKEIQAKFYFLMDNLVKRGIFTKSKV